MGNQISYNTATQASSNEVINQENSRAAHLIILMVDDQVPSGSVDEVNLSANSGIFNVENGELSNLNDLLMKSDDYFTWDGNLGELKRFVDETLRNFGYILYVYRRGYRML